MSSVPKAPGRPLEIEEFANRLWVHPASRALVDRLARTAVTPNQVSIASVGAALAAAVSFDRVPAPLGPLLGLAALFVWHVLDGADGELARRTNRASAAGELIDGVCDHASQALIYIALALVLQRSLGVWAWPLATVSALSHTFQANAYEAGRKTYRHWVYGTPWMRQRPDTSKSLAGIANRLYLGAAAVFSPGEDEVSGAMGQFKADSGGALSQARQTYREIEVRLVKTSGLLGSTGRSLAAAASLLVGTPLWFFLYEIVVLNAATALFVEWRRRANIEVVGALSRLGAELQLGQTGVETIS